MLHLKKQKDSGFDKALLIVSVIILLFGIVMLYSASVAIGLERFGDSGFFIKRQIIYLAIGGIAFYAAYKIDYHIWQEWSLILFLFSILLLIVVLIPGIGASGQGAQRWINLGFISFQPSELVKLTLLLYMSAWLAERGERAIQDVYAGLLPFVALLLILSALILKQPDLGTLLIIVFIGLVLFYYGGANIGHITGILGAGLVLVGIAIKAAPYRLARLTAFMDPTADPQGAGYHITQALLAVGSGGIFGKGLGHSRQKFFYLPEVTGDSLFAVIGEELGFIFSVGLIGLFIFFFIRGVSIANKTSDQFGKLAAIGISSWIVVQAFVNIGAMLGVLPLTGLPLPLMSYGGSSLIVTMMAIGILLNISKKNA